MKCAMCSKKGWCKFHGYYGDACNDFNPSISTVLLFIVMFIVFAITAVRSVG